MNTKPWDVLPETFLERFSRIVPPEKLEKALATFCIEKPVTFRTNTLKITTETLKRKLAERNIGFKEVSWYKDAFVLDKNVAKEVLVNSDLHTDGLLYIQGLSSMIPPLVLNPQPDEWICDLTAAPGSKTTQMAMLLHNTGRIVANDISRSRLYRLKSNLATQGVTNTEVMVMPGQALWKKFPGIFDKVLVDVPCTLEGRFSSLDAKTFAEWTPKKTKILSQLQRFLLRSAITATKPGGTIIYSTCTFEPEENEGVIDWILKKEKDTIAIESITLPVENVQQGITDWDKKPFDAEVKKTMRVLPSEVMEGFYIAKIKKLDTRPLLI